MRKSRTDREMDAVFGKGWLERYAAAFNEASDGAMAVVTQAPNRPQVPTEIIAQDLRTLADAVKKLDAGKLSRNALVVLLADATGLGKRQVKEVLTALGDLTKTYLKS